MEALAEPKESPEEYLRRTNIERAFTGVFIVWLRDVKRFWRDTPRRIGAFVQPLIYLFLLGTGLQAAFTVFGGGSNTRYVLFMFPGILGMTVLFTSVFSAISILWDRQFGFLKEVLVSPVPRSSVALGKVFGGATTACLQAGILMLLMFFPFMFGFSVDTLLKVLQLIPLIILLSIGMTGLGVAIASRLKSFESFPIIINFILLPLFFLSGAMFPLQGLPGWMAFLTRINPLTYGVDMLRGVALRGVNMATGNIGATIMEKLPESVKNLPASDLARLKSLFPKMPTVQVQRYPMWLDVLVVTGFSVLFVAIAIWQFNRQD